MRRRDQLSAKRIELGVIEVEPEPRQLAGLPCFRRSFETMHLAIGNCFENGRTLRLDLARRMNGCRFDKTVRADVCRAPELGAAQSQRNRLDGRGFVLLDRLVARPAVRAQPRQGEVASSPIEEIPIARTAVDSGFVRMEDRCGSEEAPPVVYRVRPYSASEVPEWPMNAVPARYDATARQD